MLFSIIERCFEAFIPFVDSIKKCGDKYLVKRLLYH